MDTVILGINSNIHDGSVALVVNGKLIAALSMERYNRSKKHYKGNDEDLIRHLLRLNGLDVSDVTHVTFSELKEYGGEFISIYDYENSIKQTELVGAYLYKSDKKYYASLEGRNIPAYYIHHQLAHTAYSFFTSPFERSHCLSMDASWFPHSTSLVAMGIDNGIEIMYCPNLLVGLMYNFFTEYLGLGEGIFKAGSVMGLASYGNPIQRIMDKWQVYTGMHFDKYFYDMTGLDRNFTDEEKDSPLAMDVAATLQKIFENRIIEEISGLNIMNHNNQSENICLSGGSFLNCNVNTLISNYKNVSVSPACGDDGLSAGSALYVAHNILKYPRYDYYPYELMYLGGDYDVPDIGIPYNPTEVARLLQQGKIIAWYQGKSEFGPRALGNRSLLANPMISDMKDVLNHRIKKREWFRPFAPSVLLEEYQNWFDNKEPSPFMLFTSQVKQPELVPAITHVDGSARIQTVDKRDNFIYWELINEFFKLTGVPMVLNTSLNINGEPIVETPDDAIRFLRETDCDGLVLKDRFVIKDDL